MRQQDGRWLRFDDATVTTVPLHSVLGRKEDVYLLFYQRRR